MKSQILLSIAFIILLAGCKKETPKTMVPDTKNAVPPPAPKRECYIFNADGTTIKLQMLYDNPTTVSGTLYYELTEKDRNNGRFVGQIKNNILIAEYTFQSEGTESKRQIAFQFKDNQLIEGYGEMNEDGTRFKDITKLKFEGTMPLKSTDCPK